jgi:hypothetical protein
MRHIAYGLLAVLTLTTPALAQDPSDTRPVAVTAGVDSPSTYFFRGIRQEGDPELTLQPFVNVAFAASETAKINIGSWNSFHTGSTNDAFDSTFYESDFYVSAAFSAGAVSPTILYTAYMSPIEGELAAFPTVHELAFLASFDDSGSTFPLAPSLALAFELGDYGADGGSEKGVYLEAGVAPGIPTGEGPLTLTIPMKVGLSLKDYYENLATGEDSKFGYFSIGLGVAVPLGSGWDIHGSVNVYAFGDTLELLNNGDASQVVGSIGVGVGF